MLICITFSSIFIPEEMLIVYFFHIFFQVNIGYNRFIDVIIFKDLSNNSRVTNIRF